MNVVHGEQSIRFHRPLPATGTVVGRMRIKSVTDKGAGRGALFLQERKLFDKASGELLATLEQLNFCRGDGGYSEQGGADGTQVSDPTPFSLPHLPATEPDLVQVVGTSPRMALFYRLCADRHPIHVDPVAAKAAGFSKPILHGLATYAVAGRAMLAAWCDYRPSRLKFLRARFSAPLFPGETVRTEMWRTQDTVQFRCRSVERDTVVINNGLAEIDFSALA
jgi:acyl dehydratase